jgi:hypothetical protein
VVLVGDATPDEHLLDLDALLARLLDRLVTLDLVVDQVAVAVVGVHGDEHGALGISHALTAGGHLRSQVSISAYSTKHSSLLLASWDPAAG